MEVAQDAPRLTDPREVWEVTIFSSPILVLEVHGASHQLFRRNKLCVDMYGNIDSLECRNVGGLESQQSNEQSTNRA